MNNMSFDAKRIAEGYKKRPFLHGQVIQILQSIIGNGEFELGLDIGCGAGLSTKALKQKCKKVVGADISKEMIDVANEICENRSEFSFVISKAEEVELASKVDVITAAGAIQWIDRERFLQRCASLLNVKGYLVIYDFAISDEMLDATSYNEWWHEQYLVEFPRPYRDEYEWQETDVEPFGFHMIAKEQLVLDYSFDCDTFIDFMMIQSNVNIQIENGTRSIGEIRDWFLQSLTPLFKREMETLKFKGYLWVIQNS